jgi:hypothetical protein
MPAPQRLSGHYKTLLASEPQTKATKAHHLTFATQFHVAEVVANDTQRVSDNLLRVYFPTRPIPVPTRRLRHPRALDSQTRSSLSQQSANESHKMLVSMNFGTPPPELRAVAPYLARAAELRQKEPIIAYYCQSPSYSLPAY